jgi:hypothetical protein
MWVIISPLKPIAAYILKSYPFLFQIVVLDLSLRTIITQNQVYEFVICSFNIIAAVGISMGCNFINLTMQFNEIDFLALRKFELTTVVLQIGIIVCNAVLPPNQNIVVMIMNICMTALATFQHLHKYEYELIRKMSLFYNLLLCYISAGSLIYYFTGIPLDSTKMLFMEVSAVALSYLLASCIN